MTLTEIVDQSFALAQGALAVTHLFTGAIDVADQKRLDINRYELSVKLSGDGQYRSNNSVIRVDGSAGSNAYQDLRLMINRGAGTTSPDYARVEAEAGSTGVVIARKTAVRGAATSNIVWAEQISLGPYTQAGLWLASDGQQTPVDHVAVVQNSLDVTKSVLQWNKGAGSSSDHLRVLEPDSSYAFRITGDGDLVWGGNDSLRAQLGALRAEVADLRAQLQAIRSAAAH